MQTGKWDSSSAGYDFGSLSCRRLNTSVSFDSARFWLLSEGQSRPELGCLGGGLFTVIAAMAAVLDLMGVGAEMKAFG